MFIVKRLDDFSIRKATQKHTRTTEQCDIQVEARFLISAQNSVASIKLLEARMIQTVIERH